MRASVFVGQVLGQRMQVLTITLERVVRGTALHTHILKELTDLFSHEESGEFQCQR